jgi:hypothetical protein
VTRSFAAEPFSPRKISLSAAATSPRWSRRQCMSISLVKWGVQRSHGHPQWGIIEVGQWLGAGPSMGAGIDSRDLRVGLFPELLHDGWRHMKRRRLSNLFAKDPFGRINVIDREVLECSQVSLRPI